LKKILVWAGRLVLGAVALLVLVVLGFYAVDPMVFRNVIMGPKMGDVTATELHQPQEAVPGVELDDLPPGPADTIEPAALQAAEGYAAQTHSVALLVYHRGALRYEKYWPGYDRNFRTDPFSAHKTVMGLLLGAALQDGLIKSLDEPVANYLPEFAADARRKIRIRDLAQMASGLEVPKFSSWTGFRITTGSNLPASVLGLKAIKEPGTDFQYSNASSQLLGLVIQKASGKRYADYLSTRLWSRIGAPTAYLWLDHAGGTPRTFCCIYTTARGWMHVGRVIMNHGRVGDDQVVPAQWIEQMTTPSPANPNYGIQIWLGSPPGKERKYNDNAMKALHSEPFAAPDMIYIDGYGGQRVYMVPSQDLIIVRTGEAHMDWDDAKIPNAILRGIRPLEPAPAPLAQVATP
jgi:CubicO group peptidase (beta-lactamase class C family)